MTDQPDERTVIEIDGVSPDDLDDMEKVRLAAEARSVVEDYAGLDAEDVSVLDGSGSIRADELQDALPDGWRAEQNGDGVHAYPVDNKGMPREPEDAPASFGIEPCDGRLFTATMSVPSDKRGGFHDLKESTRGLKERCVRWVADRADQASLLADA